MNTPAHVAASLFVWRHEETWNAVSALVVGAVLPDAPMFGFYVYQKLVGSSEREIWGQLYFEQHWQLLFDWFNSIPLAIALVLIFAWCGWRWGLLCAASACLHMLCDLPLHHDDAHRHLLPLSHWRYQSPVSYWDPRYFGRIVGWAELVGAVTALLYLVVYASKPPLRWAAGATLSIYAAFIAFALTVWM